jgi:hypothetical protein
MDAAGNAREDALSSFMAPSGVCRFCGRSDEHAVWADPRHTICNHPECVERMVWAGNSALHRIRHARCVCKGWKSQKRAFCLGCWTALPEPLREPLIDTPLESGFGCYVAEAVAFFRLSAYLSARR